jgi:hypothetical protein
LKSREKLDDEARSSSTQVLEIESIQAKPASAANSRGLLVPIFVASSNLIRSFSDNNIGNYSSKTHH